ncbi:MAG: hypothetical protein H7070_06995, partial [Saprospiraceae bacterium]|nr:hypothetical protein [Pyrinomonadaceae bacterium]
ARITFEIPNGWSLSSTEKKTDANVLETNDLEKSIAVAGKFLRERQINAGTSRMKILTDGEWLFTDTEAAEMAGEIFEEYAKLFGGEPGATVQIAILKFSNPARTGNWEAETRGRNITIVSSDMPFKAQSLQRLHEQLRHEIFHLWLPNGVNLGGNYDWFFEGFALYQSLKTGVLLNRISFDDFLDTLTRAHNMDSLPVQRISLIEASKNRWSGTNTQVYARGMLVAFLCDIALLQRSKGKIAVADIFKQVYDKHRPPNGNVDGNTAIINILQANPELEPIIDKYIKGSQKVEWQADLTAAGIDSTGENGRTNLKVRAKPSGRQKDLLDKLGYNSWRKLSPKSK